MISDDLLRATERAALAVWPFVGKLDKEAADQAAVTAMRQALADAPFDGEVVIGEGEMDEAPMLYRGERLGKGGGPRLAIAVDPLEGTNLTAKNQPGATCVLAAAPMGALLSAPDMYMDRLAGPPAARGRLSLDATVKENVRETARLLGKPISETTVVMLDRERHKKIMEDVLSVGARLRLITDGDVMPSVLAALRVGGVDLVLGSGGAPEGVLAAAAIHVLGGAFEGRLLPSNDEEKKKMAAMGLGEEILTIAEVVKDDRAAFAASAVTAGWGLQGPRREGGEIWISSLVVDGEAKICRFTQGRFRIPEGQTAG